MRSLATPIILLTLALAGSGGGEDEPAERLAGMRVDTVGTRLEVPWEIAFLPDRSALVTERPGRIRLLEANGELREEPVAGRRGGRQRAGLRLGRRPPVLHRARPERRRGDFLFAVLRGEALYRPRHAEDEDDRILRITPPSASG